MNRNTQFSYNYISLQISLRLIQYRTLYKEFYNFHYFMLIVHINQKVILKNKLQFESLLLYLASVRNSDYGKEFESQGCACV